MNRWVVAVVALLALGAAACSEDPKEAAKRFTESGDRYSAQGKHAEAILQYRNAVQRDPNNGPARFKLAEAYEQTEDVRNAFGEYVRAADLMPENVDAQIKASQLHAAVGQYPEAQQRAQAALAKDPKNAQALVAAGNAAAGLKDIDRAITLVEDAIEAAPKTMLTYSNLGVLQIAKGNREAAEGAFKRAVTVAPESVSAHLGLANFYWAAGQHAEAEAEFTAALKLEPENPNVHRSMATFYVQLGNRELAERHLKTFADAANNVSATIALADFYLLWEKVPEAKKLLETTAQTEAGFEMATQRLAAMSQALGDYRDAHARLDSILKKTPSEPDTLLMKSRLLMAEKKPAEALAVAARIVEGDSQSVAGLVAKGNALEALGRYDEAATAFQDVLRVSPALVAAKLKLAGIYLSMNDPRAAIEYAAQAARQQPQSPDAQVMLAKAQVRVGDFSSAAQKVTVLLKTFPESAEVHRLNAALLRARGERVQARAAFERALTLDATSIEALAGVLSIDADEGRADAIRARLDTVLKTRDNEPDLLFLAGQAYQAISDVPRAEATYRRLLQIDPSHFEAYGRLGAMYVSQGRLDEALRDYDAAAQKQTRPVMAITMAGIILGLQNKPDEARKRYEHALQIDPRAPVAANNLSWMLVENGENLDLALTHAQSAKSQLPDNGDVSDTLGWIYYKKGLNDTAIATLRQAVQQSPGSAVAHYHLGLALLKGDDKAKAEATRVLQHALKLDPKFDGADEARRLVGSKTE